MVTVSIHAPRVGSDQPQAAQMTVQGSFNPRSPRGERPIIRQWNLFLSSFQSTLPAWGATGTAGRLLVRINAFQSTLPAWGATHSLPAKLAVWSRFNPRSPRGERRQSTQRSWTTTSFNPRSPRGERRHKHWYRYVVRAFQSTLPAWGATRYGARDPHYWCFNPRSPRGERPRP